MSTRQVFESFDKVAAVSGRNAKIAILDDVFRSNPDKFAQIVNFAYNPFYTYRVTLPANLVGTDGSMEEDASWTTLFEILECLRKRTIDLREGKEMLDRLIVFSTPLFVKYLVRIVNHDLKIGIQDFKKWFPNMIPNEPVMLCDKWDGEKVEGDWVAEPKLDGYRAAIVVDVDGECTAISRGNKEFYNWEHIADQIKRAGLRNVVLDGEFYAGNFGLSGSICKTQRPHPDRLKLKYHIFDMLTMDEKTALKCSRTTTERKDALAEIFMGNCDISEFNEFYPNLVLVLGRKVTTPEEFQAAADEYYLQGYEGAVFKDMNAPYVFDRSSSWLKVKPEEECDVEVIGAEEGQPGTRLEGGFGKFLVRGTVTYKKKSFDILARVGGGLTDSQREKYWKLHLEGKLNGLIIQVRYQDVSTEVSINKTQPSLRFPRFVRERLDKTPVELGGV